MRWDAMGDGGWWAGAATTVVVFLIGWLAKRILDATAWPWMQDKWAAGTRGRAAAQAVRVSRQYKETLLLARNRRLLIIHQASSTKNYVAIAATIVIASQFCMMSLAKYESPKLLLLLVLFAALSLYVMSSTATSPYTDLFRMVNGEELEVYEETVARLKNLYDAVDMPPEVMARVIDELPKPRELE